jgi:hypothetical protein
MKYFILGLLFGIIFLQLAHLEMRLDCLEDRQHCTKAAQ